RKEALDHCLFYAPPGLGKTTLANILAKELGVNIKVTSGPVLARPGDLAAMLTTELAEGDIFFIDEIHRLNPAVEEALYPAMEDFTFFINTGKGAGSTTLKLAVPHFTLVGATTRSGLLTGPLRDRFGIVFNLGFYEVPEITDILARSARLLSIEADREGLVELAKRSRGTPRIANRLLRRARDFAQVKGQGVITQEIATTAMDSLDIDAEGLDSVDKRILEALIDEKLVVQAAIKEGMNITGSQVDQIYQQTISQMVGKNVTEAEFAELVKANYKMTVEELFRSQAGMGVAEYKVYLKNQVLARNYVLSKKQAEIAKKSEPTDSEIRSYYELKESELVQPETLKIFIAIVQKGKDSAAAKNQIVSLCNDYKAKKITADKMKTESQKKDSAYKVGDMFIGKTEMAAQQLGMTLQNLLGLFKEKEGYVSDIIENNNEWYFFVITKKYDKKSLSLSDSVQPESTTTVYDYIKNLIGSQKQQAAFMQAIQDVTRELNTPENVDRMKKDKELEKLLSW
ncbi:MAG: Holliday junction branch migration DNA helicase RuvB, partial [Spirochaetaceae bacterium]|nr:Holliday junction branch migration DNA helicase RuvB [Spirochaetaceae bacterium]